MIENVMATLNYEPKDITAVCYFCQVLDVKDSMHRVKTGFQYHKVWVCAGCEHKYRGKDVSTN